MGEEKELKGVKTINIEIGEHPHLDESGDLIMLDLIKYNRLIAQVIFVLCLILKELSLKRIFIPALRNQSPCEENLLEQLGIADHRGWYIEKGLVIHLQLPH